MPVYVFYVQRTGSGGADNVQFRVLRLMLVQASLLDSFVAWNGDFDAQSQVLQPDTGPK